MKKKAIYVDANKREVREIEIEGDKTDLLELLGGGDRIVRGPLAVWDGDLVAVNSPANPRANHFFLQGIEFPIVGDAVLIGTRLSLDQVRNGIRFVSRRELEAMLGVNIEAEKSTPRLRASAILRSPIAPDIKPEIRGEARAMLDILSDKLDGRK